MTRSDRFFRDPLRFEPERWEREEAGIENVEPFTMLHFGLGARMCIGMIRKL